MTQLRLAQRAFMPLAGSILLLSGCATRTAGLNHLRNSFLPQAPVVNMEEAAASLPKDVLNSPPALYSLEHPNLTQSTQSILRLTELEKRLRNAESEFGSGKRAYAEGKTEEARRHFNSAVDLLLEAPVQDEMGRRRLELRLEEMVESIYRYDISGLGAAESPDRFVFEGSPRDSILDMTFPIDPRQPTTRRLRDVIAATQSELPIDAHESVQSAISYFSSERGKKTLEHNLRRSGKYRAMIQRVFDEENVPRDLMYVAVLESGFYPRAVSHASAVGMWQFMTPAAKEMSLNITAFADDRMDPEKSTRAAARYFKFLYKMLGDWNLALAAYNCGPGCVDRAVQRTGYADYWKLREMHALPRDTDQYVPVILAFILMAKNPEIYGLDAIKFDAPLEYDTLDIEQNTHLELIAAACDKPVADLRDMNPALLKPLAPAGYEVHVPKGSMNRVMAAIDSVPVEKRSTWKFHKVERGETAASIARKYNMQHASLAEANTTLSEEPEEGDLLLVPASYSQAPVKTAGWVAPKRKPILVRGRWVYPPVAPVVAAKRSAAPVASRGKAPVASTARKPVVAPRLAAKPPVPRNRRA